MRTLLVGVLVLSGGVSAFAAGLPSAEPSDREIEGLAREYRIQVYRTFRLDRPQYDSRRRVGEEIVRAWQSGGRQPSQRRSLVRWLKAATAVSQPGRVEPLPPLPEFGRHIVVPIPPLKRQAIDNAADLRPAPVAAEPPRFTPVPTAVEAETAPAVPNQAETPTGLPTLGQADRAAPAFSPAGSGRIDREAVRRARSWAKVERLSGLSYRLPGLVAGILSGVSAVISTSEATTPVSKDGDRER